MELRAAFPQEGLSAQRHLAGAFFLVPTVCVPWLLLETLISLGTTGPDPSHQGPCLPKPASALTPEAVWGPALTEASWQGPHRTLSHQFI